MPSFSSTLIRGRVYLRSPSKEEGVRRIEVAVDAIESTDWATAQRLFADALAFLANRDAPDTLITAYANYMKAAIQRGRRKLANELLREALEKATGDLLAPNRVNPLVKAAFYLAAAQVAQLWNAPDLSRDYLRRVNEIGVEDPAVLCEKFLVLGDLAYEHGSVTLAEQSYHAGVQLARASGIGPDLRCELEERLKTL